MMLTFDGLMALHNPLAVCSNGGKGINLFILKMKEMLLIKELHER